MRRLLRAGADGYGEFTVPDLLDAATVAERLDRQIAADRVAASIAYLRARYAARVTPWEYAVRHAGGRWY